MRSSRTEKLAEGETTGPIINLFYRVFDRLGFGFVESVYSRAFAVELRRAGIPFKREVPIQVWYEGECVGKFKADFVVADRVIVEVKAFEELQESSHKQLLNCLRASRFEVGMLLHFGPKATFHRKLYTNDRKPLLPVRIRVAR